MRAIAALFLLSVVTLFAVGWVKNAATLCTEVDFASPYKAEVIRTVGVFIPVVGAVAGYCDIDDTPAPVNVTVAE